MIATVNEKRVAQVLFIFSTPLHTEDIPGLSFPQPYRWIRMLIRHLFLLDLKQKDFHGAWHTGNHQVPWSALGSSHGCLSVAELIDASSYLRCYTGCSAIMLYVKD